MKGRPIKLYFQDGEQIENAKIAADILGCSAGLVSQRLEDARDEGRPYAIIKERRVYMVDPATIRKVRPTGVPTRKTPSREGLLLAGHTTIVSGQVWR